MKKIIIIQKFFTLEFLTSFFDERSRTDLKESTKDKDI